MLIPMTALGCAGAGADSRAVVSAKPGADTRRRHGAVHATASLPFASVCPSNFPDESVTVAPGNAAPPLSRTVTVTVNGTWALARAGESNAPIIANRQSVGLNFDHSIRLTSREC